MKKLITLSLLLGGCSAYQVPDLPHTVSYENAPCVEPNNQGRFRTCNDFIAKIDNHTVRVPKGFDTDLASVPKIFWSVLSPAESRVMAPALLHDYMYTCPGNLSRRYADEVFYSGLIENKMTQSNAYQMYLITRMFGDKYYKDGATCAYLIEEEREATS